MPDVGEAIGWIRERGALAAADDEARFLILLNAFGRLNTGRHGLRGDRVLPRRVPPPPPDPVVPAQRHTSPAERAHAAQHRYGRANRR